MIAVEKNKCIILNGFSTKTLPSNFRGYYAEKLDKIAPGPQLVTKIASVAG